MKEPSALQMIRRFAWIRGECLLLSMVMMCGLISRRPCRTLSHAYEVYLSEAATLADGDWRHDAQVPGMRLEGRGEQR